MAQTGYDFFIGEANGGEEHHCRVCGSLCRVSRDVFGPTSWGTAMARKFTHHDEFVCPHTDKPWHEQALKLVMAIDETPSKRIAALMQADLEDLLRENLPD